MSVIGSPDPKTLSARWHSLVDSMQVTATGNVSAGLPGVGGVYASVGGTMSAVDAKGRRHLSDFESAGASLPIGYVGVAHTKDGFTPVGGVSVPFVSVGSDPITGKTIYVSVFGIASALIGSKGAIGVTGYVPVAPGISVGAGVTIVDPRLVQYTEPVIAKALGWVEVVEPKVKHAVAAVLHSLEANPLMFAP